MDKVDPTDWTLEDKKKWLEEHSHYDDYELAIMCQRCPTTIRTWKKQVGITLGVFPKKNKKVSRRKKALIKVSQDPDVWDNEEWLREYYIDKGYSIKSISIITGVSCATISYRLKKYDIPTRKHKPHKYSTPKWLVYNYGTREEYLKWAYSNDIEPDDIGGKGYSILKCSQIAKVSTATIMNWLVKVNNNGCEINIRDMSEALVLSDNQRNANTITTDETSSEGAEGASSSQES